jgi:hypothetical protein
MQLKANTDNQIAGVNQQMTAKADKSTVDASHTFCKCEWCCIGYSTCCESGL